MRHQIGTRLLIFGACLLAIAGARVQSPRQGAFDIPKGTNVLLGRVVDAGTDASIPGLVVNLVGFFDGAGRPLPSMPSTDGASPPRSVMTNADGYFIFRNLPAGRYVVMPLTSDYISESFPPRVVEMVESDKPTSISVRLSKYAAITGRVDEQGDPLAGVVVTALARTAIGGRMVLQPTYVQAITDDRGIYRLPRLPPGSYVIAALSTPVTIPASLASEIAAGAPSTLGRLEVALQFGSGRVTVMPNEGLRVGDSFLLRPVLAPFLAPDGRVLSYATTFYPGTPDSANATLVALGSGEERTTIDLPLRLVPTVRVSGVVTGPDGPMPRFALRLVQPGAVYPTDGDPVGAATAITDTSGAFTFLAVTPGQYELQASFVPAETTTVTTNSQPLWAAQQLAIGDSDMTGVVVTMKPGLRLRGRVEFRSSSGVAPAPPPATFVHLQPLGARLWRPGRGPSAPDGTFQTGGDPPGRYIINAAAPAGWTLQSITRGGRPVEDGVIELESADMSGIVIAFSDRTTRVSGSVVNADAAPDAQSHVIVFPADTALWRQGIFDRRERLVQTTSLGAFEIRSLMPGEYYIAAVDVRLTGGQANLWMDAQFLERLIAGATKFTLGDGEERTLSLRTFTPRGR